MMETINVKEIEKKTYRYYNQDGLTDIWAGILILCTIASFLMGFIWFAGIYVIILLPLYAATKQKITVPRIGHVQFGQKTKHRTLFIILILIGTVFFIFMLGLFMFRNNIPSGVLDTLHTYPEIIVGTVGGLLSLITAFISGIKRFYLYSGIIFAVFIGSYIFDIDLFLTAGTIGVIIVLSGILMLIRFIHKNPVLTEGI